MRSNEASSVMNSLIEVAGQWLVNIGFGPRCGLEVMSCQGREAPIADLKSAPLELPKLAPIGARILSFECLAKKSPGNQSINLL